MNKIYHLLVSLICIHYPLMVVSAEIQERATVEVIGTTPAHGVGLPEELIPFNVQTATNEDIERIWDFERVYSDFYPELEEWYDIQNFIWLVRKKIEII